MKDYKALFKEIWDNPRDYPGVVFGKNKELMSEEMVLKDLSEANSDIVFISNSFRDSFWGNRISKAFLKLSKKGVKITLIGGPQVLSPDAVNKNISALDKHDVIELFVSDVQPVVGARLIDGKISFLSIIPSFETDSELDGRDFMYAQEYEERLVKIILDLKNDLMVKSSRYPHVCPNNEIPEDVLDYFESTARNHSQQLRDILTGIN